MRLDEIGDASEFHACQIESLAADACELRLLEVRIFERCVAIKAGQYEVCPLEELSFDEKRIIQEVGAAEPRIAPKICSKKRTKTDKGSAIEYGVLHKFSAFERGYSGEGGVVEEDYACEGGAVERGVQWKREPVKPDG